MNHDLRVMDALQELLADPSSSPPPVILTEKLLLVLETDSLGTRTIISSFVSVQTHQVPSYNWP